MHFNLKKQYKSQIFIQTFSFKASKAMRFQKNLVQNLSEYLCCKPTSLQWLLANPEIQEKVHNLLKFQVLWTTYKNRNGEYKRLVFYDGISGVCAHRIPARGTLRFPYNCSIVQYFLEHHNIFLKFPFLPCVECHIHGGSHIEYYPLELLMLEDDKFFEKLEDEKEEKALSEAEAKSNARPPPVWSLPPLDPRRLKIESEARSSSSGQTAVPPTKAEDKEEEKGANEGTKQPTINNPPAGSKLCTLWKKYGDQWGGEKMLLTVWKTSEAEIDAIIKGVSIKPSKHPVTTPSKTSCFAWTYSNEEWKKEQIFITNWHLKVMCLDSFSSLRDGEEKELNFELLQRSVAADAEASPGIASYFLPSTLTEYDRKPSRSLCTVYKRDPTGKLEAIQAYVHHW